MGTHFRLCFDNKPAVAIATIGTHIGCDPALVAAFRTEFMVFHIIL
jgi:hypothetical protein